MTSHDHPNINNTVSPTLTLLPPHLFSHHHIDAMQRRVDPTPGDPWLDNERLNNEWRTTLQNEQPNDEGEDGDNAQHRHHPGSVPAQVSQHEPAQPAWAFSLHPLTGDATLPSATWQPHNEWPDEWPSDEQPTNQWPHPARWTTPHAEWHQTIEQPNDKMMNNQVMKRMMVTTHNIITVQGLCQAR